MAKEGDDSRLWGGRFGDGGMDPATLRLSSSVHFDRALAAYDVRGSIAQARMLGDSEIIPQREAAKLISGLEQIAGEVERGELEFDPALEDVHTNIETRLGEIVGKTAGRLHTGRSRNDQIATDLLLYLRDAIAASERALLELREVLIARAGEHIDTLLPGYTHLQRAQPVRLAHHWLAFVEMLSRDTARFRDARHRIHRCPLGSGALAGSTLALGRAQTASELGFDEPTRNSMDGVSSRDAALEFLSAGAICMVNLSRIAEELVIWSTSEFGFVELSDGFSTGSSLMPQKKNPDVPELVRGKTGRVIGNLVSLLTVMKGLPLTYNRDMQEDKEPVFDTASTLADSLASLTGAIATLTVHVERMREAAADPMLLATDLAEALVRADVPFREAHEVVGKLVAHCLQNRVDVSGLSLKDLRGFHASFQAPASELLNLERSLEERTLVGGPAKARVAAALETAREELQSELAALDADVAR